MYFDANGFIIMEQSGLPGGYGDSCAETSRYAMLSLVNSEKVNTNFQPFVTANGILRHPLSPWREGDTSLDQMCPLLAATSVLQPELAKTVEGFITQKDIATYNDILIDLGTVAQLLRYKKSILLHIMDIVILAQALILSLPLAFNPSATLNPLTWIVSSKNQSADWLNYTNKLMFAKLTNTETIPVKLAKYITSKAKILAKVNSYYASEPRNEMIIQEYTNALGKL